MRSEIKKHQRKGLQHWQMAAILLMIFDFFAIHFSYFFALWMRFDLIFSRIPPQYLSAYRGIITWYAIGAIVFFWFFRMYKTMWAFVSVPELMRFAIGSVLASAAHSLLISYIYGRMPLSYHIWGAMVQAVLILIPRFSWRLYLSLLKRRSTDPAGRVMLIGAGAAGQMILKDINQGDSVNDRVVCIIDDNTNKWGRYVLGVPIVGGRDDILASVEKYRVNKIYLAIPSVSASDKREIINICSETNCELKQLPGMYQFVLGQVTVSNMKNVAVEDLLGREPIRTDMDEVYGFIRGKTVLVTGGGGSIGSELCRQVASHGPRCLIIFDIYENNAYAIQLELRKKYPELNLVTLIGSVRDSRRIFGVFEEYRPEIVYHAAAHKHVPLMEDSPNEAIKNNAIGTYKTAYAAMVHGCERFVLVSTDKAVNPTNIMGASKRLCEMIIQAFDAKIKAGRAADLPELFTHMGTETLESAELLKNVKTEFVAVRFGNVLGSNGSVIPLFKRQIAEGGPVTVTHPDIIRYFMTIPEAVSLIMLAGTYAKGGEIFVLDMGSPVKIDTLARNLIKLSGFKPDVDIKIVYTGLRPGEKLYEEKLMAEEGLKKTENELIHIGCPIPFDTDEFLAQLDDLMVAAYNNKRDIRERVAAIVSTYHPAGPAVTVVKDSKYVALTADAYGTEDQ